MPLLCPSIASLKLPWSSAVAKATTATAADSGEAARELFLYARGWWRDYVEAQAARGGGTGNEVVKLFAPVSWRSGRHASTPLISTPLHINTSTPPHLHAATVKR